ncbi:MAG TPA: hypothetical protein VHB27_21730, partial [Rhodopila sp.]|nr:hypothetical protein [Rhodopila sp.]
MKPGTRRGRLATPELDAIAETEDEDAELEEPESGPLRRCIVTRALLPKERMIRFVLGPDRQVVP